jgi:MFS family permease
MGSWRLYLLCVFFGLGSFLWGYVSVLMSLWGLSWLLDINHLSRYNIGIIATIFVSPGFIAALSKPSPEQLGFITAIYYLGTWISYIFLSGFVNDRLGRRYAALTGTLVTCIGAALEAGAHGSGAIAMMIAGRIISGFGNAIISTSVPLYQRHFGRNPFLCEHNSFAIVRFPRQLREAA